MLRYEKKGTHAFTIIELLVVMAIILMLAAISMPIFRGARNSSYMVSCQANLKGIGRALHLYRTEHSGWMPYALNNNVKQTANNGKAVSWKYALSYYMGNHSNDELMRRSYPLHDAFVDPVRGQGEGNYMISMKQFGSRMRIRVHGQWIDFRVTEERRFIGGQTTVPDGFMKYEFWKEPSMAGIIGPSISPTMQRGMAKAGNKVNIDYRHAGKANILFLDGSVRVFEKDDASLFKYFDEKELNHPNMEQVP